MHQHPKSFAHVRVPRATAALTLGALALAVLSGCGNSGSPKASSDATSPAITSPSSTVDPQAAMKAQLLETYRGYWNTAVQAWSQGSLNGVQVDKYATGQADTLIRSGLQYYVSQNLVMRGRPALNPTVSKLNSNAKPYTATVTDCVDTSDFYPVNKDTGKPAALTSSQHRHPATYQAKFDVQWWITSGSIDRSKTC